MGRDMRSQAHLPKLLKCYSLQHLQEDCFLCRDNISVISSKLCLLALQFPLILVGKQGETRGGGSVA